MNMNTQPAWLASLSPRKIKEFASAKVDALAIAFSGYSQVSDESMAEAIKCSRRNGGFMAYIPEEQYSWYLNQVAYAFAEAISESIWGDSAPENAVEEIARTIENIYYN